MSQYRESFAARIFVVAVTAIAYGAVHHHQGDLV